MPRDMHRPEKGGAGQATRVEIPREPDDPRRRPPCGGLLGRPQLAFRPPEQERRVHVSDVSFDRKILALVFDIAAPKATSTAEPRFLFHTIRMEK